MGSSTYQEPQGIAPGSAALDPTGASGDPRARLTPGRWPGVNQGFTLVELIVALSIAGLVLVSAARIFTGVADGARAVATARERLDRTENARRWLNATLLSL